MFVIESDATIVAPLILSALLECKANPKEANKLIAKQILPLEEVPKTLTKSIHFRLLSPTVKPEQLQRLKSILQRFKGNCPAYVHLVVKDQSETILKLPDDLKVEAINKLVASVLDVFGPNVTWFQA